MTTHTKSSALIFRSILHSKKGRLEKGFTLIELLVTVGLVGFLSATALPAFINAQEKGKVGAAIGEAAGYAKECATNAVTDDDTTMDYPDSITATDTDCSDGGSVATKAANDASLINGLKCGTTTDGAVALATGTETICTFTIDTNGTITGAWSGGATAGA